MKAVSTDSLTRKALAYGAKVEVGGSVVNASRAKVNLLPVRQKAPEPDPVVAAPVVQAPPPQPIQQDPAIVNVLATVAGYAANVLALEEANTRVLLTVQKLLERQEQPAQVQLQEQPAQPVPLRKWRFAMSYGQNGRLSAIDATQVE